MLKFGAAAWALGLSIFFLGVIISDPALLSKTPPISISLLAFAAAVPVLITVAMIHKFTSKIRRLECSRRKLLMEYEKALLKRVGEIITKSK
jgi:hypothetical protein